MNNILSFLSQILVCLLAIATVADSQITFRPGGFLQWLFNLGRRTTTAFPTTITTVTPFNGTTTESPENFTGTITVTDDDAGRTTVD